MKKQFTFLFIFLLTLGTITIISAIPPEPMAFYGDVDDVNGTAIPNGYYLVAKMGDIVGGECEIIDGTYGKGVNTCVVVTFSTTNPKIEFYIGDYKIGESTFQSKEIINLNFVVTTLPANLPPLSDGVCEPRECSYNILDCDNSITKVCLGNGVCDSAIGETCENAQIDCGPCAYCGDGSCNNGETCSTCSQDCGTCSSGGGGSSGGGSSGGSSSSNVIKLSPANTSEDTNTSSEESSESQVTDSGISEQTEDKKSIFGITGMAIGNFVKTPAGKSILIFIILAVILVALYLFGKNKAGKKTKNSKDTANLDKKKKKSPKQKNIKVIKLSEMRKKSR